MSHQRTLTEIATGLRGRIAFDIRADLVERWNPGLQAAAESDATLSIYEPIGLTLDGEGITARRVSGILRALGKRDVTVNINSPGGDFFEGVAIHNLLREHPGRVTVQVLGLAASAASVIAMAGDEVRMGEGAFLMIHNAWAMAIGNRHDMLEAAARLEPFDRAMAELYAARTGLEIEAVQALMDAETWIDAQTAVSAGWAHGMLGSDDVGVVEASTEGRRALAYLDAALARAGVARKDRRDLFHSLFSGSPTAAGSGAMPCAGSEGSEVASLLETLSIARSANYEH